MLYLLRRTPVKTLKHLPNFLPIDNDFKNTALISDDEHEKLRIDILDVKNQLFVETATWGLSDWERVLDLSVKEDASIEDRRIQILLKLQGTNIVSEIFMNNLINMFCEDKSGYIIQHNSEYWFELCISGDDEVKWKELLKAVNTYKPAHLGFAVVIRIISQILPSHKANIIQYINANHNFWNLGTAENTYWDGVWSFDGSIDWSGIKPDAKYKERQYHVIDILTRVNSVQAFMTEQSTDITYKVTSKYRLSPSHKAGSIYYVDIDLKQKTEHTALNAGKINATQSRTTGNAKNLWDGFFCWDGSHAWSGDYTLYNTHMENLCTCYSTDKNGNIKKGTFERL